MKNIITLLFITFYINSLQAQDAQLIENDWYLDKLLIENEEVFPPSSNCSEQGRVYFFNDVISVDNLCCDSSCGSAVSYQDTIGFELFDGIGCLLKDPDCTSEELEYSERHIFVYFDPGNSIYFNPYTYEINNDGDNLALVVTNGIGNKAYYNNVLLSTTNFEESAITLYPNPATTDLFIASQQPITQIKVYSITGQEVLSKINNINVIAVSSLTKGVYFIKIDTINGQLIKRIIKN